MKVWDPLSSQCQSVKRLTAGRMPVQGLRDCIGVWALVLRHRPEPTDCTSWGSLHPVQSGQTVTFALHLSGQ